LCTARDVRRGGGRVKVEVEVEVEVELVVEEMTAGRLEEVRE
jgi:hypothetical protein